MQFGLIREIGKAGIETLAGPVGDGYAAATGRTVTGDEAHRGIAGASAALPFIPGPLKKVAGTVVGKVLAKGAKYKAPAKVATTGAGSAASGLKLGKSLASEAQLGEVGTVMAGPGSTRIFRDAARVAKAYGGDAKDWVKKYSSSYSAKDGSRFETHWVENIKTGQRVEHKTKF